MKLNTLIVTMSTAMALCAGTAYAVDPAPVQYAGTGGTVHFVGKLTEGACAVSTDSADQTVYMGEYTTHHFNKAGVLGTIKPFQIKLEDCDTKLATTAAVAFKGRQDAMDAGLLAIDAGINGDNTNTATGVGIQILDEQSKPLSPDGQHYSNPYKLIDGENILKFAAQYKSTATATAGAANSDATFIMQYQ